LKPPSLASRFPPLLVIVPRHPERFDAVAGLVEARGWRLARRSRLADGQRCDAQVVLGDSMGEMPAWYALADVAIIGGSLLPYGGQNLIEASAAGVPVIVGPHTFNFAEAAERAIEVDAAIRAPDAARAVKEALDIVLDADRRQSMSDRALAFAARHRGATDRTVSALEPLLRAER
jgi:3-deoxy-D-manno-octulosonic-acid transferase